MTTPRNELAPDPSPPPAARLRDEVIAQMTAEGWSVSAAAETGLSTTVLLNEVMVGASVDMTTLFDSGAPTGPVEVCAFSLTHEMRTAGPVGGVLRGGTPEVTLSHHRVLDTPACAARVEITEDLADSAAAILSALAACIEQFRLLAA